MAAWAHRPALGWLALPGFLTPQLVSQWITAGWGLSCSKLGLLSLKTGEIWGPDNPLLWETILCVVGCLQVSPAPTHPMPGASPQEQNCGGVEHPYSELAAQKGAEVLCWQALAGGRMWGQGMRPGPRFSCVTRAFLCIIRRGPTLVPGLL